MSRPVPILNVLDARVLRATDARYERSPEKIGALARGRGARGAATAPAARRVPRFEDDGERPQRWLRTHGGDDVLEQQP